MRSTREKPDPTGWFSSRRRFRAAPHREPGRVTGSAQLGCGVRLEQVVARRDGHVVYAIAEALGEHPAKVYPARKLRTPADEGP